jgi:hypothetical protein
MESRGIENDNKQEDEMWIDELIRQWLLSENDDDFFTLRSGDLEDENITEGSLQTQRGNMMHVDTSKKQLQQPLKRSTRLRRPTHKQ